jgi:uncharacterized protein YuzE
MQVNYDIMADAVYITVSQEKIERTIKGDDRFLIDMDAAGKVVGFEILDATSQQGLVENLKNNVARGVPISILESTPVAA